MNREILDALKESRNIDISDCKSVCLMLGPYRNLTTLTAAILFLHPNCQILNHAGDRVIGINEVDFLSDFTSDRLDRFVQYAIHISKEGKRGDYGGTITLSHAFDPQYSMNRVYRKTGLPLIKSKITCLLWKESLSVSNTIKQSSVDFERVFSLDKRLRFMMPIRNPLDCATSNLKTGHSQRFLNVRRKDLFEDVLQAVLEEILWFEKLRLQFPDRFFCFLEHSVSRSTCIDMADFLELSWEEDWTRSALEAFSCSSSYQYYPWQIEFYIDVVQKTFTDYPKLMDQLLVFADLTQRRGFLL